MKRRLGASAAAMTSVFVLAACGSTAASSGSTAVKTITIGTVGPFSGPNAVQGSLNKAVIAYFKNVDSHGGIDGYKINVQQGDDQFNPALTPGVVRKMVSNVSFFCGLNGTDENIAAMPILKQAQVPSIAPGTGSNALFAPVTNAEFVVVPDYGRLSAGVIQYAVQTLHKSRIALLYLNGSVGAPVLSGVQYEASKLGISLVDSESYDITATTVAPQMQRIAASHPDFVFVEGITSGFALAVNTARQIGLNTDWGNLFFGATPQFAQLTNNVTSGHTYIGGFVDAPTNPATQRAMNIVHQAFSSVSVTDAQAMQGWTLADTCAAVIKTTLAKGEAPTAANFTRTANSLTLSDSYVHGLKWSSTDHSGVSNFQVLQQQGSNYVPVTGFMPSPTYR